MAATPPPPRSTTSNDAAYQDVDTSSDEFRMYHFKITLCPRHAEQHAWSSCPWAHVGERTRRRDPRRHSYAAVTCVQMLSKGRCDRGDACPAAHTLFEFWLHPDRYKTELCSSLGAGEGGICTRQICFFAHHASELRPLPAHLQAAAGPEAGAAAPGGKYSLSAALGAARGAGSSSSDKQQQQQEARAPAKPLPKSSSSGSVQVLCAPPLDTAGRLRHVAGAGSAGIGAGTSAVSPMAGLMMMQPSPQQQQLLLLGPGGWPAAPAAGAIGAQQQQFSAGPLLQPLMQQQQPHMVHILPAQQGPLATMPAGVQPAGWDLMPEVVSACPMAAAPSDTSLPLLMQQQHANALAMQQQQQQHMLALAMQQQQQQQQHLAGACDVTGAAPAVGQLLHHPAAQPVSCLAMVQQLAHMQQQQQITQAMAWLG